MYISLDWLKDFVSLPGDITPEKLGLRLTMHTVEIDSVEKQADKLEGVVVGRIREVKPHPNADKLSLVKVEVGSEELAIVCGADNIEAGQMVPVALIGAVLPNGLEIKAAKIRGEQSEGMLCAEDELGLGDDHSGILILSDKARPGQPLSGYFAMDDVLFEVDNKSITNRPDLWGHYGMAREVAAFLGVKLDRRLESLSASDLEIQDAGKQVLVKVSDPKLCPRYMAVKLEGIKVESSPEWLRKRLVAVGVRPINNIVDITNYVMLEVGQPLHAFDAADIDTIEVRRAGKGEAITTLDGKDRRLEDNMLVITDGQKPIAVAGVMGGEASEVLEETSSVILESANFDPVSIRKTAQALNNRTEASMRFEKSLDPNLCETALVRSVELIQKVCPGAVVASSVSDVSDFSLDTGPIELDTDWVRAFLGDKISDDKILSILKGLGFAIEVDAGKFAVSVPTWRATKDISIKEDLAEEVARIYGYDNIISRMPVAEIKAPQVPVEIMMESRIKKLLAAGAGLTETHNYSFVGTDRLKKLGMDQASYLKLFNPISQEQTMLRQNLFPNLLGCVRNNQARREQIDLFEIGKVYLNMSGEVARDPESGNKLPYEEKRLGIISACQDGAGALARVKGALEYLARYFSVKLEYVQAESDVLPPWAGENLAAEVRINSQVYGFVYILDANAGKRFGVKKQVAAAEMVCTGFLEELAASRSGRLYQPVPKYPPVIRDLAFVLDEKVLYNDIKEAIISFHGHIRKVELFDIYQGKQLGPGKKSLAFHVEYQADRTLTAEEVASIQKDLAARLEEKFGAQIRDF
jgi:phenylalanyl-tRNA synthetase beta chain